MIGRGLLMAAALLAVAACRLPADARTASVTGDPARGRLLIRSYGCSSCHSVPGVPGARGLVGPPLHGVADRGYIGGVLPNTAAAMTRWIQNPQTYATRTVMPDLGVSEADAHDITAYLYTLRAEPVAARMLRGFVERARGRQLRDPVPAIAPAVSP